jgi:flavin reductase (DIM6/NTAB) family NADH-FMN oxidoreductase RutF
MSHQSKEYLHFDPKETPVQKFHHLMLGVIAPRPIAFASTVDRDGRPNLSPFSFFNAFGANPPVVVFSPSRRGKDNTTKDTYENIKEIPEVVINAVTFDMVQKVSDSSADFAKGVNEFEMVGFTMQPSELIRPFRVKESPVQMECKVLQVIETGFEHAAGNLVICEILRIHVIPEVLDEKGRIDPNKIDLVGRLGGEYYVRASGSALFEVAKPDQIRQ